MTQDVFENVHKCKKLLEQRDEHFKIWLQHLRELEKAVPTIQSNFEHLNWQISALDNLPDEATEIPFRLNPDQLEKENNSIFTSLPLPGILDYGFLSDTSSSGTASSAVVFDYVGRIGDNDSGPDKEYSSIFTDSYKELQNNQDRPKKVKELLGKLNSSNLVERYDAAWTAYNDYKVDSQKKRAGLLASLERF